ncbi:(1-_4)-alpha-D-glucan 1-alpha-D-glucosylmutase [Rhodospirillales bacterium URHD0017]|nr:(1->4)-alpha-D-glucan 1-alpha-D-glucosylmutase [Rhodospirillales bacterium URHD0017]
MTPRATLRLQFHRGFAFADAEALVPYFARLGVSHLYASPIATARPGSQHGYDVIDATRINPELGGKAGLRALSSALAKSGMGMILDIVPNHMAADTANAWWADVLRHGRASRFARWFDIDWEADDKVLLPILGRPLDEVLAAGELERDGDSFRYFSHRLPAVEGGLEEQHWRLAWWRSAGDRINWRRFFDINELVCLRMEEPEAFEAVHALPLRLHQEGIVDGLRIDHVDGLTDPAAYCQTLRARLGPGAWLVVEKILLAGETLPADWGCDGTTGYDFMDEVNALQHESAGERALAEAWSALSGRPADFAAEEEPARREILARSFGAQLDACAAGFAGGELAPPLLRRVLGELLAHFPVYRTYSRGGALSAADRAVLDRAAAGARRSCLATDRWAIDPLVRRFAEPDRRSAVARFQQLSAPIAAKAVEDTGFYRYGRLLSRNDVGFDPATFALDADAFHRRMQRRRADWPRALLATATHDHKRGEDVRARLAVLSGMAAEWAALQRDWVEASRSLCRDGAPVAGDVALLLQTIVGAWPVDLDAGDRAGRRAFAERLAAWQQKALREAKLASDWAAIDEPYEAAARDFTTALVAEAALPDLLQRIAALVHRIAPAGALNGLAQCLLRLTVPGVPDLYQGGELWDLSLVDPDNRRPVDWPRRVAGPPAGPLRELAAGWRDGRIKQALIARALTLRQRLSPLFEDGDYRPVRLEGPLADAMFAFVRRRPEAWALVVAPRLALRLPLASGDVRLVPDGWRDTAVVLDDVPSGVVNAFDGAPLEVAAGRMPLAALCGTLPLALASADTTLRAKVPLYP